MVEPRVTGETISVPNTIKWNSSRVVKAGQVSGKYIEDNLKLVHL